MNQHPLLSEDDDLSSSNYQDSMESSMISNSLPVSHNNSLVNSRTNLSSSNENNNILTHLNNLALLDTKSEEADDEEEEEEEENDFPRINRNSKRNTIIMENEGIGKLSKSLYYDHEQPIKPVHESSSLASSSLANSQIFETPLVSPEKLAIIEETLKPYINPMVEKVLIRFQSIGSTKQIDPRVFKISNNQKFVSLIRFLNKKFKLGDENGHLFCYVHNSFSPNPDETIANLFKNFAVNNELVISYCEHVAFG